MRVVGTGSRITETQFLLKFMINFDKNFVFYIHFYAIAGPCVLNT